MNREQVYGYAEVKARAEYVKEVVAGYLDGCNEHRPRPSLVRIPYQDFRNLQFLHIPGDTDDAFQMIYERKTWAPQRVFTCRIYGVLVEAWAGDYVQLLQEL